MRVREGVIEVKYLRGLTADMVKPATDASAGFDLRAVIDTPVKLYPGETKMIPSGMAINMMDLNRLYQDRFYGVGVCAKIYNRSGISTKKGIMLANNVAVIDADFQKEIMVPLWNRNVEGKPYIIEPMDRIAQLIFEPVIHPDLEHVGSFSCETGRGGFGSTGVG